MTRRGENREENGPGVRSRTTERSLSVGAETWKREALGEDGWGAQGTTESPEAARSSKKQNRGR